MLYNPSMKGTGRIAIKFKDGAKCVISKCYVRDTFMLEFSFSNSIMPIFQCKSASGAIECVDCNSPTTMIFCEGLDVLSNGVRTELRIMTNLDVENMDDESYFPNYYISIAEPEESCKTIYNTFEMQDVECIIADPDLFITLLNEGVIRGREETLKKFELLPNIRMYKGGKSKTKLKSANKKVKYIK